MSSIPTQMRIDNLSFSPYRNHPHSITLYLDTIQRWLTNVWKMYEINYKAILQKELKVRQIGGGSLLEPVLNEYKGMTIDRTYV